MRDESIGECPHCGCHFRTPQNKANHCCAAMSKYQTREQRDRYGEALVMIRDWDPLDDYDAVARIARIAWAALAGEDF